MSDDAMQQARKLFAMLPEERASHLRALCDRFSDGLLTWGGGLRFALGAAGFALGFALIAQYGFDYKPCMLCLWQRIPYILILAVALAGLFAPRLRLWRGALLLGCGALFLADAGIAAFHIGVEQHWWLGTSGCAIQAKAVIQDAESLREALLASPVAHCDQISWTFIGLSMATWNMFFALTCAIYAVFAVFFGKAEAPAPKTLRYGKAENQ